MMDLNYKTYLEHSSLEQTKDKTKSVELHVIFENGKFLDTETKKEIKINNGSFLTVLTDDDSLIEREDIENHTYQYQEMIAESGEEFIFGFISRNGKDKNFFQFKLRINEDLIMTWKGKKKGKLQQCKCEVFEMDSYNMFTPEFSPIEADSLNIAYTLTSTKYRTDVTSHTCNVFKIFVDKDIIPLDEKRRVMMQNSANYQTKSLC